MDVDAAWLETEKVKPPPLPPLPRTSAPPVTAPASKRSGPPPLSSSAVRHPTIPVEPEWLDVSDMDKKLRASLPPLPPPDAKTKARMTAPIPREEPDDEPAAAPAPAAASPSVATPPRPSRPPKRATTKMAIPKAAATKIAATKAERIERNDADDEAGSRVPRVERVDVGRVERANRPTTKQAAVKAPAPAEKASSTAKTTKLPRANVPKK